MYLKRLELRGFKTFATYTDFVFDEGITAIVGPNGSGKSNVADAVRWVLGEQSFSALRGKRTEDMIFAGTSRRAQLGMAEAVLTLDNSSHWLPLDFEEVTIARRAYRSGENQYLVNGSRTRLRDVSDLLGKTGLGRQGFVVIGQGLVDAALSLRPDERRILLEEAAGIHIYQEKRSDALQKLAETHQNTLRLGDILNEIAPRLRDLERQAKRAEERQLLTTDLEKLLHIWYGHQWQRVHVQLSEAESLVLRRLEETSLGRARVHEIDALVQSTRFQQNHLRRQLSTWHKTSAELHDQAEINSRDLAVARERLGLLTQRLQERRAEIAQWEERRAAAMQAQALGQAELEQLLAELSAHQTELSQRRLENGSSETARRGTESETERLREQSYRLTTLLADARNRLAQTEERLSQVRAERERQLTQVEEAKQQLEALRTKIEDATRQQHDAIAAVVTAQGLQEQLEEKNRVLESQLNSRRSAFEEARRQRHRAEDRRDLLRDLRESMAGLNPAVKTVLQSGTSSGVIGAVASLVQVPERLERAIESALGANAQALVVHRWEDASAAIALLRSKNAGWATFLPLDTVTAPAPRRPPQGAGILGLAVDLVTFDEAYAAAFKLLLGAVVIVEDLDTARRVRPNLSPGQRIVTLQGEVVQSSGVLSGGSARRQGGLLAQEREWRELPAVIARLQETERAAQAIVDKLMAELQTAHKENRSIAADIARAAQAREGAQQLAAALAQQQARHVQQVEWGNQLQEQQAREMAALQERLTALQQDQRQRSELYEANRLQLDTLLARLEGERQEEQSFRQALASAETAVAVAQRQVKMQQELVAAQAASAQRAEQELVARKQTLQQEQDELANLSSRVLSLDAEALRLSADLVALGQHLEPAEAEVVRLDNQLAALESDLDQARQRLVDLEAFYNQQVLERERRLDAIQSLQRRIEEDLGDIEVPTERAQQLRLEFLGHTSHVLDVPVHLPEDIQSDIRNIKAHLRRLGPVNPAAPQEYRELLQRHDFMATQLADLTQSASSLQQVIQELDQVMEKEFLTVFRAVAIEFSRHFETLFGGGSARLELLDPGSLATTGLDIIAHPPGKRQQSLALLSGGERALTATALLFAVLKARPMPFCFLDEVDAMLDEANVGRFRSLLQEFAQRTQFVIISHNRRTIEAARTIYGVSMSEEGVSRVISLQLPPEETA